MQEDLRVQRGSAAWEYYKLLKTLMVLWGEERLTVPGRLEDTALSRLRGNVELEVAGVAECNVA